MAVTAGMHRRGLLVRDRLVIGAAIVVLCLAGGAFAAQTVLAGRDPTTIHAVGSLPDRISVCGRTWTKDVRLHEVTLEQASALREGGDAVVVATGTSAADGTGRGSTPATGGCRWRAPAPAGCATRGLPWSNPSPSREVRVERPEEHIHHGPERRTLLPEERLELLAIASPPLGWVEAQ
jgi:hypothetical protein